MIFYVLVSQIFVGQVVGTSVGTDVFIKFGWRPGAALSLGWAALMLLILLLRGPHCKRYTWFGYEGGFSVRRKTTVSPQEQSPTTAEPTSELDTALGEGEGVRTGYTLK